MTGSVTANASRCRVGGGLQPVPSALPGVPGALGTPGRAWQQVTGECVPDVPHWTRDGRYRLPNVSLIRNTTRCSGYAEGGPAPANTSRGIYMQQWMRTRVLRTVGLLFGLSLMLTACDPADFFAFFGGGATDDAPAAEGAADGDADTDDSGSDDSGGETDDVVTDESDAVSEESDAESVSEESEAVVDEDDEAPGSGSSGEHQCFRNRDGGDAGADAPAEEA